MILLMNVPFLISLNVRKIMKCEEIHILLVPLLLDF